jgi:hypothetical protein
VDAGVPGTDFFGARRSGLGGSGARRRGAALVVAFVLERAALVAHQVREAGGLPALGLDGLDGLGRVHDQPENVLIAASTTIATTIPTMRSAACHLGCRGRSGPLGFTPPAYGAS